MAANVVASCKGGSCPSPIGRRACPREGRGWRGAPDEGPSARGVGGCGGPSPQPLSRWERGFCCECHCFSQGRQLSFSHREKSLPPRRRGWRGAPDEGPSARGVVRPSREHCGTRNPEPGTRNPEPGTRNPEPGTRNPELGTRNSELRTQNSELRTQNSELRTQNSELRTQNSELRTRAQRSGFQGVAGERLTAPFVTRGRNGTRARLLPGRISVRSPGRRPAGRRACD